jgi:hypothetical protein
MSPRRWLLARKTYLWNEFKMKKNCIFTRGLHILTAMALGAFLSTTGVAFAADGLAWDKTFPPSDKATVEKVSFYNRLGINLVGDMYLPKNIDRSKKSPAIIVGHPFGGVKEQSSGLYAQKMAERGFITLAFDASYNGESGGQPRSIASPEAFGEDFSAAVDFLGTRSFVNRNRIGVIGICGSGGFAISAAQIDPRMKAIATVSMYNMGRDRRQGLGDTMTKEDRIKALEEVVEQRWIEFEGGQKKYVIGTPEVITKDSPAVARECPCATGILIGTQASYGCGKGRGRKIGPCGSVRTWWPCSSGTSRKTQANPPV